jgi:hypothetical protein
VAYDDAPWPWPSVPAAVLEPLIVYVADTTALSVYPDL